MRAGEEVMDQPTDPKTWFAAVSAALMALLAWNAKRQVEKQDSHDDRIRALETDRVTKGDITAVYERVNQLAEQSRDQYDDLSTRMGNQHTTLLRTIISQRPD
jgi:hypothetical protein